jgi:hypothetical protein
MWSSQFVAKEQRSSHDPATVDVADEATTNEGVEATLSVDGPAATAVGLAGRSDVAEHVALP